jgi:2-polyprenyl-3-methyl-5-hydroxy-6-metoxy-1,4-benzoquinol methylase
MSQSRLLYAENHWSRDQEPERALDKYLAQYDSPYSKSKTDAFAHCLEKNLHGKKILDYGGGIGYMSVHCAKQGADVVLVDVESNALETARLFAERAGVREKIRRVQSDVFPDDLRTTQFDIINQWGWNFVVDAKKG